MTTSIIIGNNDKPKKSRTFTDDQKHKIVEKLVTARVGLLLRHPFFGNLATRLELVDASDWCPTIATDGRKFYYSNEFVNKLTPKQAEFGFAHEVLHNVFDHMGRRGDRDPELSNIAADYAVNQILKDDKIGEVPSFIKIFQDNKYRGWSYEQIYEELKKNVIKINPSELGELLDEHLDGDSDGSGDGSGDSNDDGTESKSGRPKLTDEEKKKIREEIKEAVIAAAQSAPPGSIPGQIRRMISDLTDPKMDWRELIRMNIQSIFKNDFSFARPNRRSQHSGAILPGLVNDQAIDVALAIDLSGSISDRQAKDFISEVKGIMDEYECFNLKLWCFDTSVYNFKEFDQYTSDEIYDYKLIGGGGTDFMANWRFMNKNDIVPKKFIMFTDGEPGNKWGDEDYCDTLFIIHGNEKIVPPFGQVAYYK
jgi:hypothetical protein